MRSRSESSLLSLGVLACALFATACGGNENTPFPEGLEPVEPCEAVAPAPVAGVYDEHLGTTRPPEDAHYRVHGRGWVTTPIAEVWRALGEHDVCIDRRAVDAWSVTEDVETGYDRSFRVRNTVEDFVTVEFDVTWRQSVVDGSQEAPSTLAARFQKTWGTTFIEYLSGSIVARSAGPSLTEIEYVERIQAFTGGADEAETYLRDLHDSIVERAHGRPLPPW